MCMFMFMCMCICIFALSMAMVALRRWYGIVWYGIYRVSFELNDLIRILPLFSFFFFMFPSERAMRMMNYE